MPSPITHPAPVGARRLSTADPWPTHRADQVRSRTWSPGRRFVVVGADPVTDSPLRYGLARCGGFFLEGLPEPVWFPGPPGEFAQLFELVHRVQLDGYDHPIALSDRWMSTSGGCDGTEGRPVSDLFATLQASALLRLLRLA